jgi:non-lysosomal glucosylceramidase
MRKVMIFFCLAALRLDMIATATMSTGDTGICSGDPSCAAGDLCCPASPVRHASGVSSRAVSTSTTQGAPELFARGRSRVYSGKYLEAISMPLGGLGGGNVQINGKAQLHSWQIFNNYDPLALPHTFFAVRVSLRARRPVVRALQTAPAGPFAAMDSLTFRGEYPFGWFDFQDPCLPVVLSLEAFSPLIPTNAKDSAIPCAVFNISVNNTSEQSADVSFLASQQNAVGYRTPANRISWGPANLPGINGRKFSTYGGNRNRIVQKPRMTVLHMTAELSKNSVGYGDMTLAVIGGEVTGTASWESLEGLAEDFVDDGRISGPETGGATPIGETLDGALTSRITVAPGAKKTVSFLLTWHFANGPTGSAPGKTPRRSNWFRAGRMYSNWWSDSLDVATYLRENLNRLAGQTRAYHDALYETNLPYWLLDRITSQVACLKSQTCFWDRDGYFGGWEGCLSTRGCCKGNCTHVWQYAQAHARLFPSIGRRMREQSFFYQNEAGGIPMRHSMQKIAFDGQCGEILGAYREYLCSADKAWLDKHWPHIRKAIEYVISTWDSDEDGVLTGQQHNTLDAELSGSTSWLGTLYLAALSASEKMALLQGHVDLALIQA